MDSDSNDKDQNSPANEVEENGSGGSGDEKEKNGRDWKASEDVKEKRGDKGNGDASDAYPPLVVLLEYPVPMVWLPKAAKLALKYGNIKKMKPMPAHTNGMIKVQFEEEDSVKGIEKDAASILEEHGIKIVPQKYRRLKESDIVEPDNLHGLDYFAEYVGLYEELFQSKYEFAGGCFRTFFPNFSSLFIGYWNTKVKYPQITAECFLKGLLGLSSPPNGRIHTHIITYLKLQIHSESSPMLQLQFEEMLDINDKLQDFIDDINTSVVDREKRDVKAKEEPEVPVKKEEDTDGDAAVKEEPEAKTEKKSDVRVDKSKKSSDKEKAYERNAELHAVVVIAGDTQLMFPQAVGLSLQYGNVVKAKYLNFKDKGSRNKFKDRFRALVQFDCVSSAHKMIYAYNTLDKFKEITISKYSKSCIETNPFQAAWTNFDNLTEFNNIYTAKECVEFYNEIIKHENLKTIENFIDRSHEIFLAYMNLKFFFINLNVKQFLAELTDNEDIFKDGTTEPTRLQFDLFEKIVLRKLDDDNIKDLNADALTALEDETAEASAYDYIKFPEPDTDFQADAAGVENYTTLIEKLKDVDFKDFDPSAQPQHYGDRFGGDRRRSYGDRNRRNRRRDRHRNRNGRRDGDRNSRDDSKKGGEDDGNSKRYRDRNNDGGRNTKRFREDRQQWRNQGQNNNNDQMNDHQSRVWGDNRGMQGQMNQCWGGMQGQMMQNQIMQNQIMPLMQMTMMGFNQQNTGNRSTNRRDGEAWKPW